MLTKVIRSLDSPVFYLTINRASVILNELLNFGFMYFYTYMSTDGDRFYIGRRQSECHPTEDAYFGSCRDKEFKANARSKIILGLHSDVEDASEAEIYWQKLFKVVENPLFANRSYQTSSKFSFSFSPGTHPLEGKQRSEEVKEKIRETLGDKNKGLNNGHADLKEYSWINKDGRTFVGTRFDFINTYGLSNSAISMYLSGSGKSVKGWSLKNRDDVDKRYVCKTLSFEHKDGTLELNTTSKEMCKKYPELNYNGLNRMARGERPHHKGWSLYSSVD